MCNNARVVPWSFSIYDFQYPRTDRGVCNTIETDRRSQKSGLSVSSNGSWCVQRVWRYPLQSLAWLSVSSNGSWCVQRIDAGLCVAWGNLSVSSNGSWCVQPAYRRKLEQYVFCFQYPRTDRGVCNSFAQAGTGENSTGFQYPRTDRGVCNQSVHCRESVGRWSFQYPRTDRGVCNQHTQAVDR